MSDKDGTSRRIVLKSLGTATAFGVTLGPVAARQGVGNRGGPPGDPPGERTIEWDGKRGSEYAEWVCEPGEQACWHWVLTRGGPHQFEEVGELEVTFDDGYETSVGGWQAGNGAYHFDVCRAPGGTIDSAKVDVTGGGANALLTISEAECVPTEVEQIHWQLDFAEGDEPPIPPKYWPDDIMSALGDTVNGVEENPSHRRQQTDGQLNDVDILDKQFHFDDENEPTQVTVYFSIDDGAPSRYLHLALFELPGPFDEDEIDEQEYVDHVYGEFTGGDEDSLTLDLTL